MNEPICSHCGGGPASEEHRRECEEDTVLYQQQSHIADLEAENACLQGKLERIEAGACTCGGGIERPFGCIVHDDASVIARILRGSKEDK